MYSIGWFYNTDGESAGLLLGSHSSVVIASTAEIGSLEFDFLCNICLPVCFYAVLQMYHQLLYHKIISYIILGERAG